MNMHMLRVCVCAAWVNVFKQAGTCTARDNGEEETRTHTHTPPGFNL